MGLIERKLMKQILDATQIANQEINTACKTNFTLEIDKNSFPMDEKVLNDFFMHRVYGLDSIYNAFNTLSVDEMTLDAVNDQIKVVKLINTATHFGDAGYKDVKLNDGVLEIYCAFSEGSENLHRPDKLAEAIERILS